MRLIDADEILKAIDGRCGCDAKDLWAKGFDDACNEIYEIVEDAPTIEAEPVRHAHWYAPVSYDPPEWCSYCNERTRWAYDDGYCPNCGAKMDGGADNGNG